MAYVEIISSDGEGNYPVVATATLEPTGVVRIDGSPALVRELTSEGYRLPDGTWYHVEDGMRFLENLKRHFNGMYQRASDVKHDDEVPSEQPVQPAALPYVEIYFVGFDDDELMGTVHLGINQEIVAVGAPKFPHFKKMIATMNIAVGDRIYTVKDGSQFLENLKYHYAGSSRMKATDVKYRKPRTRRRTLAGSGQREKPSPKSS